MIWAVEDTTGHLRRNARIPERIDLRLYQIVAGKSTLRLEKSYEPGSLQIEGSQSRAELIMELLAAAEIRSGVVVCSHRTASPRELAQHLRSEGLDFVLEINADTSIQFRGRGRPAQNPIKSRLRSAEWMEIDPAAPNSDAKYFGAVLGTAEFAGVEALRCFAVSTGGIKTFSRGTLVAVTTLTESSLDEVAHLLGWVRWLRPAARKVHREPPRRLVVGAGAAAGAAAQLDLALPVRANLQIARRIDEAAAAERDLFQEFIPRGVLAAEQRPLNVVELFAGAGGMGLGFLLAQGKGPRRFRIVHSGEIHPIYAHTLRTNHRYLREHGIVDSDSVPDEVQPADLAEAAALERICSKAKEAGGVDILIGGPPCQGFSSANRNSWSSANPNNRLVDTFLDYADALQPRVLLMENVQGILWTPPSGSEEHRLSVAAHVVARLKKIGYEIFPKLLDAAWYGVPQHRNRFFLLAIHGDLGYKRDEFGPWGPFPVPTHGPGLIPFVTVGDAITDLPRVENGHSAEELEFEIDGGRTSDFLSAMRRGAPQDLIWDHVVSRQANYVIERYRRIPQGGNWESVVELMTNYANVTRTHSNIYRRLKLSEPSITIGHYRKSMIVHPVQHRGLSLREAARLQSFPDWFRLAGAAESLKGGLTHKQQQLANAVCPLVTQAVASLVARL